jgi:hypothetical protein
LDGYNEWNAAEVHVPEDTVRLEIRMTHPVFSLSTDSILVNSEPEQEFEEQFQLTNAGNGPLQFTSRVDVLP